MILVIFLKIYIYFFILKKCGGIFGGFGCMYVREGLSELFYLESSNFFVYNYYVNLKIII